MTFRVLAIDEVPTVSSSSSGSAEPSLPFFPPELVSFILFKLWEVPQPMRERFALLRNIALINHTWLSLVARIICQDAHICSSRGANAFLRLLPKRSAGQQAHDLFTIEASRVANEVCRSITFYVEGNVSESPGALSAVEDDGVPNAISLVLDALSASDSHHLPNLRHIALHYKNCGPADALGHLERGTFPRQVTSLSVDYVYTVPSDTTWLLAVAEHWIWPWVHNRHVARAHQALAGTRTRAARVPTLRHLSLGSEVTAEVATEFLEACPCLETLELGLAKRYSGPLSEIPLLPASVRTVVLRNSGVAWLEWWLMRQGTYDVELVYERDDARDISLF
ncbi:hypothetical protein V8D89_016042 [Ganoderma adspersum]